MLVLPGGSAGTQDPPTGVETPPFDTILPENSWLFVSADLRTIGKKYQEAPFNWISESEAVSKWAEGVMRSLEEEFKSKGAGFKLRDLLESVQGEVAFFMDPIAFEDLEDPPILDAAGVLINAGEGKERFSKIYEKLLEEASKKTKPKVESFESVNLNIFRKENDKGPDTGVVCAAGTVFALVIGEGDGPIQATKKLVSHLKSPPKTSLATSALYKTCRSKIGATDAVVYFNLSLLKDLVQEIKKLVKDRQGEEAAEGVEKGLAAIGLSSIRGGMIGISATPEGIRFDGFVPLDEFKGLWKLFGTNRDLTFSRAIPEAADRAEVTNLSFDALGGVYDEVMDILTDALQDMFGGQNPKDIIQQFLGIDVKEDLLDPLGNAGYSYEIIKKPYSEGSLQNFSCLELKDGDKFLNAIDSIVERVSAFVPMMELDSEEIEGGRLYTFKLDPRLEIKWSFGVSGNRLLWGDADLIKANLKGAAGKALVDNEEKKWLLAKLPRKGLGAGVSGNESIRYVMAMLKDGKLPGLPKVSRSSSKGVEELVDLLNLEAFPLEEFLSHSRGTAWWAAAEDGGIRLTSMTYVR